jgi:hypothetical protein
VSSRPRLARALGKLGRMRTRAPVERPAMRSLPEETFRAVVDERLRGLERQLDEVKGRVNGLLFLLAGAVASQIVLRLLT